MTEEAQPERGEIIVGGVSGAEHVRFKIGRLDGPAGFKRDGDRGELAYEAKTIPAAGTSGYVGGKRFTILSAQRSAANSGTIIAQIEFDPGQ